MYLFAQLLKLFFDSEQIFLFYLHKLLIFYDKSDTLFYILDCGVRTIHDSIYY